VNQAVVGYLTHYKKTILTVEATEFLRMASRTNVRDLVLPRIRSLTFVWDDMKLLTRVYLDFSLRSFLSTGTHQHCNRQPLYCCRPCNRSRRFLWCYRCEGHKPDRIAWCIFLAGVRGNCF